MKSEGNDTLADVYGVIRMLDHVKRGCIIKMELEHMISRFIERMDLIEINDTKSNGYNVHTKLELQGPDTKLDELIADISAKYPVAGKPTKPSDKKNENGELETPNKRHGAQRPNLNPPGTLGNGAQYYYFNAGEQDDLNIHKVKLKILLGDIGGYLNKHKGGIDKWAAVLPPTYPVPDDSGNGVQYPVSDSKTLTDLGFGTTAFQVSENGDFGLNKDFDIALDADDATPMGQFENGLTPSVKVWNMIAYINAISYTASKIVDALKFLTDEKKLKTTLWWGSPDKVDRLLAFIKAYCAMSKTIPPTKVDGKFAPIYTKDTPYPKEVASARSAWVSLLSGDGASSSPNLLRVQPESPYSSKMGGEALYVATQGMEEGASSDVAPIKLSPDHHPLNATKPPGTFSSGGGATRQEHFRLFLI